MTAYLIFIADVDVLDGDLDVFDDLRHQLLHEGVVLLLQLLGGCRERRAVRQTRRRADANYDALTKLPR